MLFFKLIFVHLYNIQYTVQTAHEEHVLAVFIYCKGSGTDDFYVTFSVFPVKLCKSSSLKLNNKTDWV